MDITRRILMEARYIISLNKGINELVPIMNISKEMINEDIYYYLKNFDLELYNRVISILQKNC